MGARILVVEDNADLHLGLALLLKHAGHTVLSAMNGDEAIRTALREQPNLILLDIGLPGRSGHLVASSLAANASTQAIPIIYLTARHELKHRLLAGEKGAAAYLIKPCNGDELFRTIDAVINPTESAAIN
jgi:DNA-binding response OmpR family regulator